ncbi:MAG: hypothetical protein QM647_02590 [Asticcacaulis sp.]|uniref:alginate O-acetyltransferase AlgX-related protein n=1 Tax=Asticcacaulis sp. TaxID=1872648 RepID=UPI0039E54EC9
MRKPFLPLRRLSHGLMAGLWALTAATPALPTTRLSPLQTMSPTTQPAWDCAKLAVSGNYSDESLFPLVRGRGDWMFRGKVDFKARSPVSGALVANFVALKKQLAKSNTRLVLVLAPPRSVLMRDFIDPSAPEAKGYSPDVALASYQTSLQRLRDAGLIVPDVMATMKDPGVYLDGESKDFYLPADIHWAPFGAFVTAVAVQRDMMRQPAYSVVSRTDFKTTRNAAGTPQLDSFRQEASRICKVAYKPILHRNFVTSALSEDSGGLLSDKSVDIALVGTSFSTVLIGNFSGFLEQALHADVANYAIGGGGFSSAILSWMLSGDYAQAKPKYLIWEMQYHNLEEVDKFPMILGAADGDCGNAALLKGQPAAIKLGQTTVMTVAKADATRIGGNVNVVVDLTSPDPRLYHLSLTYADGKVDRFDVDASRWSHPANKMIIRLPRDGADLSSVSLVPQQRLSGTASAHVCRASV